MCNLKQQKGTGLIEVLVSLFTLAIGLLGILGLQVNALGSNQRAEFVTEAQVAAQDIISRIQSFGDNDQGADTGNYLFNSTSSSATNPNCIQTAAGCSDAELVITDTLEWIGIIRNNLPGGQGIITWDAAESTYTITVLWDQDRTGAIGTNCQSRNTETDLTCYQMRLKL